MRLDFEILSKSSLTTFLHVQLLKKINLSTCTCILYDILFTKRLIVGGNVNICIHVNQFSVQNDIQCQTKPWKHRTVMDICMNFNIIKYKFKVLLQDLLRVGEALLACVAIVGILCPWLLLGLKHIQHSEHIVTLSRKHTSTLTTLSP